MICDGRFRGKADVHGRVASPTPVAHDPLRTVAAALRRQDGPAPKQVSPARGRRPPLPAESSCRPPRIERDVAKRALTGIPLAKRTNLQQRVRFGTNPPGPKAPDRPDFHRG